MSVIRSIEGSKLHSALGMTSHVLSALAAKRSELTGEVLALRLKLDAMEAAIEHLDHAILIFDPDYKLEKIRPKRRMAASEWFERGEAAQLALSGLHEHPGEWTPTPTIVTSALEKKNLAHLVRKSRDRFSTAITMALSRYYRRGVVERSTLRGEHGEYSWRLSPTLFDQQLASGRT